MAYAKTIKLRYRVGALDLPYKRKIRTSSLEEDVDSHMCPYGTTTESRRIFSVQGGQGMYIRVYTEIERI